MLARPTKYSSFRYRGFSGARADAGSVSRRSAGSSRFAPIAARHDLRLDDDVPEFTRGLLDTLHGAFLRPFPSCAIAQFHGDRDAEQTEPRVVARGTQRVTPIARQVFLTGTPVAHYF
ncbi:type VI secretion system baseplate subunit TssF [Burkholderia ubonensis]|uniref:type VI secretion system baseplate subunit TssF n=1 Tax=Burkholderia ubonensis TaxID=101571 RepID=UPI0009B57A04